MSSVTFNEAGAAAPALELGPALMLVLIMKLPSVHGEAKRSMKHNATTTWQDESR